MQRPWFAMHGYAMVMVCCAMLWSQVCYVIAMVCYVMGMICYDIAMVCYAIAMVWYTMTMVFYLYHSYIVYIWSAMQ